jgi:intein/homing endonuclease
VLVKLTYFKAWNRLGGKYYSTGEYVSEKEYYFDVVEEVRKMHAEGCLPDLMPGHSPYHVLVTTEPETVPHLLIATHFINPKEST